MFVCVVRVRMVASVCLNVCVCILYVCACVCRQKKRAKEIGIKSLFKSLFLLIEGSILKDTKNREQNVVGKIVNDEEIEAFKFTKHFA